MQIVASYHHDKEFDQFSLKLQARIRRLREERGLSQEDMLQFELSLRTMRRIEDPKRPANITLLTLFKLARAFKMKPQDLLNQQP